MKKCLSTFISAVMLLMLLPIRAQAAEIKTTPPCEFADTCSAANGKELHLEYMEFYNNQGYYKSLAKKLGYTLVISVGEEFEKLEQQRIFEESQQPVRSIDEEVAPSTRGVSIPTKKYKITDTNQYTIDGHAVQSTLYTEKMVYGVTGYEVSIHNRYEKDTGLTLEVTTHGFLNNDYFYVDPGKTVIRYYTTHATTDTAYLEFRAPSAVDGYIKKGVES